MSKVPTSNDKALATVNNEVMSLIPAAESMDDGFVAPKTGEYLPFLEMVFPIMVNQEAPWYKGKEFHMGFREGTTFQALPAGTVLTLIDKRNSVRQKIKEGTQTKNKYAYAGIERKGQKYEASAAEYNELAPRAKGDDTIDAGFSMVVVALFPDGRTVVLDFSAYRTMEGYMYPALSPALLVNKIGLRIDVENHEPNLTKSKFGFFYPDARKFKQWAHVQLDKEQLTRAVEAINLHSEEYMNWLNR